MHTEWETDAVAVGMKKKEIRPKFSEQKSRTLKTGQ